MTTTTDTVITYQRAYVPGQITLCDGCVEADDHGAGALGSVSHGAHRGECEGENHGEARYTPCSATDIPEGVRFDIPRRNQGQTIEVAYGGFSRAGHDEGDDYRRTLDRSTGETTYARLVESD
jgi:hypothetical protein